MTQWQSSKTYKFVRQTLTLPLGEWVDHMTGCRGEFVGGACGGTYRCNACDQTCGRCMSKSPMPGLCLVCSERFEQAPNRDDPPV